MSVYDSYLKERKTSESSVYSQYQIELAGNSKPKTSLFQKAVVQPLYSIGKAGFAALDVLKKPSTPKGWKLAFGSDEPAKRGWETWSSTIDDTSRRLNEMMDAYTEPNYKDRFLVNAGVKTVGAGVGIVNSAFAGVSSLINTLTPVPVVGHFADGFNKIFEAAGTGASSVALDALYGSSLDDDLKVRLDPVVSELASLVGMAIAGKATGATYKGIRDRSTILLDSMKKVDPTRTVPVQSTGESTTFGTTKRTGNIRVINANNPIGKVPIENKAGEYYPPADSLPVIEFGSKAKTNEKVIQIEPTTRSVKGDFVYEPVREPVASNVQKPQGISLSTGPRSETRFIAREEIANRIIEKEAGIKTETNQSPGYTQFQSETALKLQRDAAQKGMTLNAEVPFQERMNMMENLKSAEEFVKADPVRAEQMLGRGERFPNDIKPGSVWKELKQKSIREKDYELGNRLSRIAPASDIAQSLKSFDEMVKTDADPIEAMRRVRELKAEAKNVDVKKEVRKLKPKLKREPISKETWNDFVKSLEC
jgi:hypothetical protein